MYQREGDRQIQTHRSTQQDSSLELRLAGKYRILEVSCRGLRIGGNSID